MCVYLSLYLYMYPSINLSYLFNYLSTYLIIYPSIFIYLIIFMPVCLTNQLSISLSIYIIYLGRRTKDSCYLTYNCTHISSSHISIFQTNYLFIYLSVSVYLSSQLLYISLSIYIIYLGSRTQGSSC